MRSWTRHFLMEELYASMDALQRFRSIVLNVGLVLSGKGTYLNLASRRAAHRRMAKILKPTEARLLECLMRKSGKIFGRESIFDGVWGGRLNPARNSVDAHIACLRRQSMFFWKNRGSGRFGRAAIADADCSSHADRVSSSRQCCLLSRQPQTHACAPSSICGLMP